MDIAPLSDHYQIKALQPSQIPEIYNLCAGNPEYYSHCPPMVSVASIKQDMELFPEGCRPENKYFLGYFYDGELIALIDFLDDFPETKQIWIGLFMVKHEFQKQAIGTKLIASALRYWASLGREKIRLAYMKSNLQAQNFWKKNGFVYVREQRYQDDACAVIMEKTLAESKSDVIAAASSPCAFQTFLNLPEVDQKNNVRNKSGQQSQ